MPDELIVKRPELLPPVEPEPEPDDTVEMTDEMRGQSAADQTKDIEPSEKAKTVSLDDARKKRGRRGIDRLPNDLTDTKVVVRGKEQVEVFFQGLQLSANIRTSAAFAGLPLEVVASWIRKGRDGASDVYIEFLERIERTVATFEMTHLGVLHEAAAAGNAKASMWLLERVLPSKYGRDEKLRITGESEKPVTFKVKWPDPPIMKASSE